MAKQVYEVVQALLVPFVLLGAVGACLARADGGRRVSWFWKSLAVVAVGVLVLSFLREKRLIRYNQMLNVRLLVCSLASGLAFAVLVWAQAVRKSRSAVLAAVAEGLGVLFLACHLLYAVPVIFSLPFHFLGMYDTYFSTMYVAQLAGYLFGWAACALLARTVFVVLSRCAPRVRALACSLLYAAGGFMSFVSIVGIINAYYRRKIRLPAGLRKSLPGLIAAERVAFFVVLAGLLALALAFFAWHVRTHGAFSNPAERRKLRAHARNNRRWAAFLLALSAFAWADMTAVRRLATKTVELSRSEPFTLAGGEIFIPLEQVSDGHLHRFTWTNDAGRDIRFIIVQKQGMNFGVGFDACDVCGDVGYYERKDEVVCDRCDVVMNKRTIGLKGGCNPVPLASRIADGGIVILTDDLQKEAHRFRN